MGKINLLPKNVYNRIAAGEVIERPYSAVKELIENSVDAGATEIEVHIAGGGVELIKVIDNGCGIDKNDLRAAFLPHATSKITKVEDLDSLTTLGFRGEALASIGIVSDAEIISVTKNNLAYKVTCKGGHIGSVEPAVLDCGTIICVRNLFYNAPVRSKFLKLKKKEEADIINIVIRHILGNPTVAFKLYIDDKLTYQSYGGGLDEAFAQVYGSETISNCFKLDAEVDGVKVKGFISNQNYSKPNRTYQTIFLNGRFVINDIISTAIAGAYKHYLMTRSYPLYMLSVEIPPDTVDVNMHPNKIDVRFSNNSKIYGSIYKIISSVLDGTTLAPSFVANFNRVPQIKSTIDEEKNKVYNDKPFKTNVGYDDLHSNEEHKYGNSPFNDTDNSSGCINFSSSKFFSEQTQKANLNNEYNTHEVECEKPQSKYHDPLLDEQYDFFIDESLNINVSSNKYDVFKDEKNKSSSQQQILDYTNTEYKGNLFNTYLIYEVDDTVYFIDQHAAHERLIYDRLVNELKGGRVARQPIIGSYKFRITPDEKIFLDNNKSLIWKLGFLIKPTIDNCEISIEEIPAELEGSTVREFFYDLLACVSRSGDELDVLDLFKDKIASAACKSAIKAGKQLTCEEINELFKQINGNVGLKCPHGRPICVAVTKKEIEKMFKRIV